MALFLLAGVKAGKGGHRHVGKRVIRGPRKGRVHDDQIHGFVPQGEIRRDQFLMLHAPNRAFARGDPQADPFLQHVHAVLPVYEVQRADVRAGVRAGDPVRERVHLRAAKDARGVQTGEHGCGQVRGRGHDVRRNQGCLHHVFVEPGVVAAGMTKAGQNGRVCRRQQGAGAAGQVADAQLFQRLGIAPVHALEAVRGQLRQQGGGGRQRVEGGQKFAVANQALEQAPVEVVRTGNAIRRQGVGSLGQQV